MERDRVKMELGETMELRDRRGSQLEEEDIPYIVERQIQPLSTYSARDLGYYCSRQAVLPQGLTVLPRWTAVLPLQRQGLVQARAAKAESGTAADVVLPLPLAVLPQGQSGLGWEGHG